MTTRYLMTEREIHEATGFDNGEKFTSEEEVRKYFTSEAQRQMFGHDAVTDAALLCEMAEAVIENRWHCSF